MHTRHIDLARHGVAWQEPDDAPRMRMLAFVALYVVACLIGMLVALWVSWS